LFFATPPASSRPTGLVRQIQRHGRIRGATPRPVSKLAKDTLGHTCCIDFVKVPQSHGSWNRPETGRAEQEVGHRVYVVRISGRWRAITQTRAGIAGCGNAGAVGSQGARRPCWSIGTRRLAKPQDCDSPAYPMKQPDEFPGRTSAMFKKRAGSPHYEATQSTTSAALAHHSFVFRGQDCQVKYL
jgi:hypothetical protein